jgi:type VI secretion system protein ImpE
MPAYFTWANGGDSAGLIPTRYPGSEASADAEVRRSRRTEWLERPGGAYVGQGQRMLFTDNGEYPLMEVRSITLVPSTDEAGGEAGAGMGAAAKSGEALG